MIDLIQASKICKDEREKRGLSREDLHKITKLPVDIIRRLEEDENYLKKEPYAYFQMKVLLNHFGINEELSRETLPEEPKKEKEEKIEYQPKSSFFKFFKGVFGALIIVLFTALSFSFKEKEEDDFASFLSLLNSTPEEKKQIPQKIEKNTKVIKNIHLKAKNYVWITAYIDGKEKVIKLTKGQSIKLKFNKKIKFETIGNANNLIIIFDDKKVALNQKIIHNLFVDNEGVFYNGYNLAQEES
ncbi:helix-turn-helix domain-containing protein [Persephonella sp. KM09-Lau-8]|uniref:helix-turn-helix domain-containing protein n=1 Tax=Persephonella sp. KM09-Lau-8 TaxID=1158345 RepID=UPI0004985E38|nr:helix-turn-helix domain-containing protein [Persephonella sp. KM09-Lau-8]